MAFSETCRLHPWNICNSYHFWELQSRKAELKAASMNAHKYQIASHNRLRAESCAANSLFHNPAGAGLVTSQVASIMAPKGPEFHARTTRMLHDNCKGGLRYGFRRLAERRCRLSLSSLHEGLLMQSHEWSRCPRVQDGYCSQCSKQQDQQRQCGQPGYSSGKHLLNNKQSASPNGSPVPRMER
jgi:hypothetical protein